jgi:hypothetical protein
MLVGNAVPSGCNTGGSACEGRLAINMFHISCKCSIVAGGVPAKLCGRVPLSSPRAALGNRAVLGTFVSTLAGVPS